MNFSNQVFILDNLLNQEECFGLIEYYEKFGPTHQWQNFFPRSLTRDEAFPYYFIERILGNVSSLLEKKLDVVKCELVFWPTNSQMVPHKDFSRNETVFTSITYLNDNFVGGRTYFVDDIEFQPKVGRTVCFDGKHYLHGVSQITEGCRYSLPIWYKFVDN